MPDPQPRRNLAAILIGSVTLLFGLVFLVGGAGAWLQDTRVESGGGEATGVLLDKQVVLAVDGNSDFVLEYRFTLPDGAEVSASRGVTRETWERLEAGDPLSIRYDPFDTARNFPAGEGVTSLPMVLFAAAIGLLLSVLGAAILAGGLRRSMPEE